MGAGAGLFRAVAPGDTTVSATWQSLSAASDVPVSVFSGTGPLRTFEIFGAVRDAGGARGAIDGAVVEILDGLVAGRAATTGAPPSPLPGYVAFTPSAGSYRLLRVPPGTYTLRVTKEGYVSQQRAVTVTEQGGPSADFDLQAP